MPGSSWQEKAKCMADGIRLRVLAHTIQNDGGYLSQACSSAEIFAALYTKILCLGGIKTPITPGPFPGVPGSENKNYLRGSYFNGPAEPQYDRFILSPTHYSLVLYAALIEAGRMAENGLDEFNKDGSSVEMIGAEHSPGMEVMTGSLGQGLAQAAGMALGRKLKKASGRIVVFMSDGEFQIGMTWETIQFLAFHKLDNVLIYADINRQQCDGRVKDVMNIDPLDKKLEAFGASVITVDGHNIDELARCNDMRQTGKPAVVLAVTDPVRGIPLLAQNIPKLHYLRFKSGAEKNEYASLRDSMRQAIGR